ncbi:MAG: putative AAA+ superfamily ATPase [Rhodothermales bacterium]
MGSWRLQGIADDGSHPLRIPEGPKACGKTETGMQQARSTVRLDADEAARQAARVAPEIVLAGEVPRLIDEWQIEPSIWNHVRRAIDERKARGLFILAGSAVPADDIVRHTGAGRISRLRMRTMSLYESGWSSGHISFSQIFRGESIQATDHSVPIGDVLSWICRGGWPATIGEEDTDAFQYVRDYLDEIRRADIRRVDGVDRDPVRVERVIRSYARHIATYASVATISADAAGADVEPHPETVSDYLQALDRLMITEDQPAWAPHLRSRSRLRSAPKRHFVDPSLAVAAMRATPQSLLADLRLAGFLFESLVVRDLRIFAQATDARVLQYRDNTGLEVDAVVEHADGRWAAFEVKLGSSYIEEAADTLLRFADRIDTSRVGLPTALAVVVPGGYGYRRPDGVSVLPLAAMGP